MNATINPLFLKNNDFIAQIVQQREHDVYACITALNFKEEPIDQIQGKITTGSINIDGDSNIRRTCSLTLISDNININDIYWGIKTKIKLDIGLRNHLTGEYAASNGYPEIVWFPQGYYVLSSFNASISASNATISIQGKDKMCLLNGDLSGQLTSQVDFGTEEIITEEMIPVTIIKEQFNNSNKLMQTYQNKYYIKEVNKSRVYKSEAIDVNYYPKYIFIKDDNGDFYTIDKNVFLTISNKNIPTNSLRYDIYKLIDSPGELFESSTQKEVGKIYYKKQSEQYFILDDSENTNANYYALTNIYERNINVNKVKIPVDKIIREAVHAYAQEPYQNIIINDLSQYGLEKMTYKGDATIYILYNTATEEDEQIFFSTSTSSSLVQLVTDWDENQFYNFQTGEGQKVYLGNDGYQTTPNDTPPYKVKKYSYGDDIGYQLTDLTYAGDLICNEGEALTAMLDKIKTMLGEFEYFYNEEGKFIFQKKKNYLQTSWTQLTNNEYGEPYIDFEKDKIAFDFKQNQLLSSISNSPVLNNVHNDITVWGKRKGISGAEIPIHARYAIDKKPKYYKTLQGKIYYTKEYKEEDQKQYYTKNYHMRNPHKTMAIDTALFVYTLDNDYANCWWNLFKLLDFYENVLNITVDTNSSLQSLFSKTTHSSLSELKKTLINNNNIINLSSLQEGEDIDCFSLTKNNDNTYMLSKSNGVQSINYYISNFKNNEQKQYYIYIPSIIPFKENDASLCVDWRELIYQMALDYFAAQGCSEENPLLIENGQMIYPEDMLYEISRQNPEYYPSGYTGYEQYYTDLQGFWRQLYNPDYVPAISYTNGYYDKDKKWISGEKTYNFEYYFDKSNISINQYADALDYETFALDKGDKKIYWNRAVFLEPETLNFWFDFIDCDEQADLVKFSIPQIGDRNKVVKEDKASSIIFKEAPNIVFYLNEEKSDEEKQRIANTISGYSSINLPSDHLQYFTISTKSLSVKDKLDELLYQYSYCTENISINSIPIYHLSPNTRIFIQDDKTEINGEYIIHKLTIPLTYNGMMSISASKAPERLY